MSQELPIRAVLTVHRDVRYAASMQEGTLATAVRPDLMNASDAESDRYEELLVNPAILALTVNRGNIDCGGLDYILIRYGSFFQLVMPIRGGHLSVCIEPAADVLAVVHAVREIAGAQAPE